MIVGFVFLVAGGDVLVRGASAVAKGLGISPLVIGLTVVAFGTSAPELAATLASALRGVPELGLGNVLGSNVANIGLILGTAALVSALSVNDAFQQRDLPLSVAVTVAMLAMTWDGSIGRLDGAMMLAFLAGYLTVLMRRDPDAVTAGVEGAATSTAGALAWGFVIGGVVLLTLGAEFVVRGATSIAETLGVPERVVGLTMVAFGTSLPELASSIAAAARREGDMILGNIAGSNLFNVLAVVGVTVLVRPMPAQVSNLLPDVVAAVAFSVITLVFAARGRRISRPFGGVLVAGYAAYVTLLFVSG